MSDPSPDYQLDEYLRAIMLSILGMIALGTTVMIVFQISTMF